MFALHSAIGDNLFPNKDTILECQRVGPSFGKNASIKDVIRKSRAEIIMLQETRRGSIDYVPRSAW